MVAYDLDARARTISPDEAAQRLGWHPRTLANARWRGSGPPYVKVGGRVRYRLTDLAAWLDAQAVGSEVGASDGAT